MRQAFSIRLAASDGEGIAVDIDVCDSLITVRFVCVVVLFPTSAALQMMDQPVKAARALAPICSKRPAS